VEKFFLGLRKDIKDQTVGITNEISKSTCNSYLPILEKTQKS
jgi:hypothetical protein